MSTPSRRLAWHSQTPDPESPAQVDQVDPGDGATGVFRDVCVVIRLSTPVDPDSLTPETLRVLDPDGWVPAALTLSPDLRVVVWQGERLLTPDTPHFVVVCGVRDAEGRAVAPRTTRFVPCDLALADLSP